MEYVCAYARANRNHVMERVLTAVRAVSGLTPARRIDVHHNYARMENHFRSNVMVHRKGATAAYAGQLGIIPGSQGTPSYIVEGKGIPESFNSCSHGAGRAMSCWG